MPTPRYTLTYQPTIDDHAHAAVLIGSGNLRLWRVWLSKVVFYLVVGGGLAYFVTANGNGRLGMAYGLSMVFLFALSIVSTLGMRRKIETRVRKMYEQKKNIGLAVPSSISLYDGYLETSSTLERSQIAWDVIETISRRDGLVLITYGLASVFVPERIFEDESACAAFVELAQSLHAAAHAQPGDLTTPRWGGTSD